MSVLRSITSAEVSSSFGTDTSKVPKASAGKTFGFLATNINGSVRYFHIFDKITAIQAGDVPAYSIPLPAGSAAQPTIVVISQDFFGPDGKYFNTGVAWGVSTTNATFTAATASDHNVMFHWA